MKYKKNSMIARYQRVVTDVEVNEIWEALTPHFTSLRVARIGKPQHDVLHRL